VRTGLPAAPPRILPQDPDPEIAERTQHRWHVNGDGTLCVFQDEALWNTRATLSDVLVNLPVLTGGASD